MNVNMQEVLYAVDAGVATITINRPERKNALSIAVNNRLTELWAEIDRDADVRVAILTSTDCGVFCAGMDLKEAAAIRATEGVDVLTRVRDPFHRRMREVEKPIIAAMTGDLMAGGMLLAINADLRVGLAGSRAGITEVKVGRGSPWAVPALSMLPQPILMELVLTGNLMPMETLAGYGFLNALEQTPDAVRERARRLAADIVRAAPLSVRAAKASVRAAMDLGCEAGLERAAELHKVVYASEDAIEGPRAFAEKRLPQWRGR
jgi:enoyl-CoA hydratase/carnithine racemase